VAAYGGDPQKRQRAAGWAAARCSHNMWAGRRLGAATTCGLGGGEWTKVEGVAGCAAASSSRKGRARRRGATGLYGHGRANEPKVDV
jgi:hypothetical protein